mmetsp:Transcript_35404/g.108660  ORF Transcript_35404/g.108660 Transcript_35404/m.108660 type:complete len:399 (+) Transcript_35404:94-1290(+)
MIMIGFPLERLAREDGLLHGRFGAHLELVGGEDRVDLVARRELELEAAGVGDARGERDDLQVAAVDLLARLQIELLLVERARDFRGVAVGRDALRQDERLLVRAHVLRREDAAALHAEDRELGGPVEHGGAQVLGEDVVGAEVDPARLRPPEDVEGRRAPHRLGSPVRGPVDGPALAALLLELDHLVRRLHLLRVGELLEEVRELVRLRDDVGPLVVVRVDAVLHATVQLVADAERIVDDDGPERREPRVVRGRETLEPGRGPLEALRREDVVHEEAVDVLERRRLVDAGREERAVARVHAAVARDVQVVAVLRGNHPEVFALRLGALSGAARHGGLHLVRRPEALVAVLDGNGEVHGVLDAVAAPGRADARLDRSKRLAVRVARLHARRAEVRPDLG